MGIEENSALIKDIDERISFLEKKQSNLRVKRLIMESMYKMVKSMTNNDKAALYEILQEENENGDIGWDISEN